MKHDVFRDLATEQDASMEETVKAGRKARSEATPDRQIDTDQFRTQSVSRSQTERLKLSLSQILA
jgi:cytidylate kinase